MANAPVTSRRSKLLGVRNCAADSRTYLQESCLQLGNLSRRGGLPFFVATHLETVEEVPGASPFSQALRRFGVSHIRIRDNADARRFTKSLPERKSGSQTSLARMAPVGVLFHLPAVAVPTESI